MRSTPTVSISFCTTCRNRLWQLRETLPQNLECIAPPHQIVLVDYGSDDGLSEWVWRHLQSHIENKKLVFFEVTNEVRWNVARAKNLAHRLGTGNYLFNLDADNYITDEDVELIEKVGKMGLYSHQWSETWEDGSFGRIGIPKAIFQKIGGYDETLLPMGGQDVDIIQRLAALKYRRAKLAAPQRTAVQNQQSDKIKELIHPESKLNDPGKVYRKSNIISLEISKFKLEMEGAVRLGGGFSYKGLLNGKPVVINGFDEISFVSEEAR